MTTELKVCSKCHLELPIDQFTVTNQLKGWRRGFCRACEAARVRAYYAANADYRAKTAANSVKWQKANPQKAARIRRGTMLKRKYDLTHEQFDQLLAAQGGCCALCKAAHHGVTGADKRNNHVGKHQWLEASWRVDHNHETDEVRGLLCHNCNTRLGSYEALMREVGEEAVLDYLTRPSPVLFLIPVESAADIRATARFVADLPPRYTHGNCEVCGEAQHAGGLCFKHYMRKRRTGDAGGVEPRPKGTLKGGTHYKTVLTEEQAREIKFSTEKGVVLAARYGVKPAVVSSIRLGLTWKHIEQDAA